MLRDLYHAAGALFPEGQAAADLLASDLQIALLPNLKGSPPTPEEWPACSCMAQGAVHSPRSAGMMCGNRRSQLPCQFMRSGV